MASEASDRTGRVIVVGGGPVGLSAAIGLTRAGVATTLVTPSNLRSSAATARPSAVSRTVALFQPSLTLLERLGVARIEPSAPLAGIRIVDDMGGVLRAPEVLFHAADIGAEAFGHNIPNDALEAALRTALAACSGPLEWLDGDSVAALEVRTDGVTARLSSGRNLHGTLVIAADGRNSICRTEAGISVREHRYEQAAVTASFTHQRAHHGISTEFHRRSGPCTTVPLPGNASSLVWVERPDEAARIAGLNDEAFSAELEVRLQGLLGPVSNIGPRGRFVLTWMQADTFAASRVLLAGEAAHVIPPIGAQGLNLGLRDVGCLIDCVADAAAAGGDLGGASVLVAYQRARATDIASRMTAVDALNRSLLAGFLPVSLGRGIGLHAMRALPALRRRVIGAGLWPPGELPRLMKPATNAA